MSKAQRLGSILIPLCLNQNPAEAEAEAEATEKTTDKGLDARTEMAMKSYTKWIAAFVVILVIFVAAFAPLIYYATVVQAMEEKAEQKLDDQANMLPKPTPEVVAVW